MIAARWKRLAVVTLLAAAPGGALGCGEVDDTAEPGPWWAGLPYASEVVSFTPGEGAGFGEGNLPDVVLGPPQGKGTTSASLDVLSLGAGGEIVLGFGDRVIVDGEGADFVVFENPFYADGDPDQVFAELGEIAVSEDGEAWHTFECVASPDDAPPYVGCAGWRPTLAYEALEHPELSVAITGGDAFDLAEVGLSRARFVRIRDLWGVGASPSQGFDLDAVGILHVE
ncbi:cell surface protein [Lujinxingia litoralis]|uniref:Cell surface protein n=1 Tax=Lujinxingia litoralis TaxID=2211119 RepID=A0A328C5Q8_9DELT|nr:cell surface protein [Lujinxingia litoralis]RAL21537.1 cell surface protein [Lujinxingia litoralis]